MGLSSPAAALREGGWARDTAFGGGDVNISLAPGAVYMTTVPAIRTTGNFSLSAQVGGSSTLFTNAVSSMNNNDVLYLVALAQTDNSLVAPTTIYEGEEASIAVNLGIAVPHRYMSVDYTIDAGPGSLADPSQQSVLENYASGASSSSANASFRYADDGTYTVTAQGTAVAGLVGDLKGNQQSVGIDLATQVTVLNVAPTIVDVTSPTLVDVLEPFFFSALATDPGFYDLLSYAWDFDDDGVYDFFGQNGSWSFDTAGLHAVGLQVSDGDGGFDYFSFDVTAQAVPEPSTLLLTLLGAGVVACCYRQARRRTR